MKLLFVLSLFAATAQAQDLLLEDGSKYPEPAELEFVQPGEQIGSWNYTSINFFGSVVIHRDGTLELNGEKKRMDDGQVWQKMMDILENKCPTRRND